MKKIVSDVSKLLKKHHKVEVMPKEERDKIIKNINKNMEECSCDNSIYIYGYKNELSDYDDAYYEISDDEIDKCILM